MASRSTESTEDMARELTDRLMALGRAHDLVRPLPNGQGDAALLGDLLFVLMAPYDDMGAFKGRIRVAVERLGVGQAAATGLALVFDELATNSMKYGALSVPTGTLDLSICTDHGEIVVTWLERGGRLSRCPKDQRVSAASWCGEVLAVSSAEASTTNGRRAA
jgi:two-component sensor histidine kinase